MIRLKTKEDIKKLREGGNRLAKILAEVATHAKIGVSTAELDTIARDLIGKAGDTAAFLGYESKDAATAYPAALCVSINDEVVHGIPNKKRILKDGDVVGLDLGLVHEGLITDHAVTVSIGNISDKVEKLIETTLQALAIGISAAEPGKHIGDIGFAIEEFVKPTGFGIVRDLAGHGVGYDVHEDPFVPNYGNPGEGPMLKPGMIIAIEPMLTGGGEDIFIADDGWTVKTADHSISAHFEHTILITEKGPEILTR